MPEAGTGHRALVLSPFAPDHARGNVTTARRTARRLAERGVVARVTSPGTLAADLAAFAPDVLHGIHAGHTARALAALDPGAAPRALVLTIGGNDLYEELTEEGPARDLLCRAGAVVAVGAAQRDAVLALGVDPAAVVLAPKHPEVGRAPLPGLDELVGTGPVLAWSGSLRSQKRPEWLLALHRALAPDHPGLVTLVAGPAPVPGEDADADALEADLVAEPGLVRVPTYPPGATADGGAAGTLLGVVDLVVNTSRTEGVANFLLEAMHEGVPVLAARTLGNAGWLGEQAATFDDLDGAIATARRLLADPAERAALGARGRAWLTAHADPGAETDALLAAHRLALAAAGG